jgi:hypothetical protein
MGQSPRSCLGPAGQLSESPGPTAYAPNQWAVKPRTSLGSVFHSKRSSAVADTKAAIAKASAPGPGSYNVHTDKRLSKATGTTFGTVPRASLLESLSIDESIPGPGLYDQSPSQTKAARSPICKHAEEDLRVRFGKAPKQLNKSVTLQAPGPGSYAVEPQFGEKGPKARLIARKTIDLDEHLPGPGAYNPIVRPSTSPLVKMRPQTVSASIPVRNPVPPGPADYSPKVPQKRAPSAQ